MPSPQKKNLVYAVLQPRLSEPPSPKTTFPFLSLPPEIRNHIYLFVLGGLARSDERWLVMRGGRYRRSLKVCTSRNEWRAGSDWVSNAWDEVIPFTADPALLLVSRQFLAEAAWILYPRTFVFKCCSALHLFLSDIGPSKVIYIERIVVKEVIQGPGNRARNLPAFFLLRDLPNLKELELVMRRDQNENSPIKGWALDFYRDAFRWLEHVATFRKQYDAAVDLVTINRRDYSPPYTQLPHSDEVQREFVAELRSLLALNPGQISVNHPPKKVKTAR
jgi:hypothetical protein